MPVINKPHVISSQMSKSLMDKLDMESSLLKQETRNISIRLPVSLTEDLKILSKKENMGYQTLAKGILLNFVTEHRAEVLQAVLDDNERMKKEIQQLESKYKKLKKLKKVN